MTCIKPFTRILVGALTLSASSFSLAQTPNLGTLGGLDSLLSMPNGASLPNLDSNSIINPPGEKLLGGLPGVVSLGATLAQNPDALMRPVEFLAIPAGFTLVPILEVLATNPISTPDYLMNGGTIIFEDISVIPRVPLVNQPIN